MKAENANYETAYGQATVEIGVREVTLTSATDSKVYDGTPLVNETITVTGDGFVTGEGYTATVTGSQTEAGTSKNYFTYELTEGTETANYQITKVEGELTVTKASAAENEITATPYSNMYDGAEHRISASAAQPGTTLYYSEKNPELDDFNEESDWSTENPAYKDAGTYTVYVKGENANFETAYASATVEITKRTVVLTSANDSKVYNGEPLTNSNIEISGDGFVESEGADYNVTGSRTNVGTSDNSFDYTLKVGTSEINYIISKVEGTLEVTPAAVTITVHSTSKNYGEADPEFKWTVEGLVKEDDLGTITAHRIAEDAKKENAGDDITITADYVANENYVVTIINGKLNIVAAGDNKVVATGRQVTYDGKAYGLTEAYAVREGSKLYYSTDNVNFTETAPEFTEAGVYVVYVKATNPNYVDTPVEQAKVIILKRDITITADSASKRYDGTELTANSAKLTAGTVVEGQTWSVTVTGSQKSVGTSKNIAKDAVIKSGDRDVTANYNISYEPGELTVISNGGGGGGGDHGNNGGNPSYKPDNNGPGTTPIGPGEVPLAMLPDTQSPADMMIIDDGEIPLAALPKTGQASVRGTLTMMLSGIMLAITALNKKRKEEEDS